MAGKCMRFVCVPVPMDNLDHHELWIMPLLIQIGILSLLCHIIVAETRVLGIRILPFPSSQDSAALNRQLIIRCDVSAYPPVDAQNNHWFYENEKNALETGQKYTIYKEPSHGVVHELKNLLTIHGVTSRQLGKYTCYARNSAGMAGNATVTLQADESSNINIKNDDYLSIDTTENDQLESNHVSGTSGGNTTDDDIIGQSTSSSGTLGVPLLKVLVLSAIAIVHTRRNNAVH